MAENLYKRNNAGKDIRNCKLEIEFKNNLYCYIKTENRFVFAEIDKHFAKSVEGAWFSPQMRAGKWDGKKHFLTKLGRFPNGLLTELVKFCKEKQYQITFVNEYPFPKPGIDQINERF